MWIKKDTSTPVYKATVHDVPCGKSRPVARIDGPGAIHFTACGRRLS
jgi:hypothetical protein